MTLTCVKFVAKSGKYNANDVAGFRPHEAKRYVDGGKAVYYDPNPPAAAESPEKVVESKPEPESKSESESKAKSKRRVRSMEAEEGKGYETKDM